MIKVSARGWRGDQAGKGGKRDTSIESARGKTRGTCPARARRHKEQLRIRPQGAAPQETARRIQKRPISGVCCRDKQQ